MIQIFLELNSGSACPTLVKPNGSDTLKDYYGVWITVSSENGFRHILKMFEAKKSRWKKIPIWPNASSLSLIRVHIMKLIIFRHLKNYP